MTKRLSIAELNARRRARAEQRSKLKPQRDLFPHAEDVPGTPLMPTADSHLSMAWGPMSGELYVRSWEPSPVLDESPIGTSPHAQPYFTVGEYHAYNHDMDADDRSTFLLVVAFSLQSDGL